MIQDFREFIDSLNANKVKYILLDGVAVIYYGYPRLTEDIDFWIKPDEDNIDKFFNALKDFGFEFDNLSKEEMIKEDQILQLGFKPNRIDIITSVEGLNFDECYERKIIATIDNLNINMISKEDLIKNKMSIGRSRDALDVEELNKIKKKRS